MKANYLFKCYFSKKPVEIVFPITYRCNSKCSMCARWETPEAEKELSTQEISNILEQLRDFGIQRITITGGEPLIRKDIFEILNKVVDLGMKPILNSNAILFNKESIKKLIKVKGINIIISLDTLKKDIYQELRGVDKLDQVISNIKLFKKIAPEYPLRIHMVVTSKNYKEVDDLLEFCKENNLKLSAMPYNYEARFESNKPGLKLEQKELANIFKKFAKLSNKSYVSGFKLLYEKAADWVLNKQLGRCNAGIETLYLNIDGQIAPCANLAYFGDLKHQNLKDIYNPKIWEAPLKACYVHPKCFVGCYWGLALLKDNKLKLAKELIISKKLINIIKGKEF